MGDLKISALPAAGTLSGNELFAGVQSGVTAKITANAIAALATPATPTVHYTICTSGTRPATPTTGDMIFETDTLRVRNWDGAAWKQIAALGAWDTWTPAITGGAGTQLGNGTISGRYVQLGRTCHFLINLTRGSTTVLNAPVKFSLPLTRAGGATRKDVFSTVGIDNTGAIIAIGQTFSSDSATTTRTGFTTNATAVTVASTPQANVPTIYTNWGDLDDATNVPFVEGAGDSYAISGIYETT